MATLRFAALLVAFAALRPPPPPPPPPPGSPGVSAAPLAPLDVAAPRALVVGADSKRRTSLAFTVWLIRGSGRTVLMDAGVYRDKFIEQWRPSGFVKPSDALSALGV